MSARALGVSATTSYLDGVAHPGVFGRGPLPLVNLVDRASRAGARPGVVLVLDDDALPLLGLPAQLGPGSEHEAAPEAARAAGWRVTHLGHWTSFWPAERDRTPVHMVTPAWVGAAPKGQSYRHGDLVLPGDLGTSTYRLARFAELSGAPYQLTPGWSAINAIRDRKYVAAPYWRPRLEGPLAAAVQHGEPDLSWRAGAEPAGAHRHRYDANLAYLGAAQLVNVAADQLQREPGGRGAWDPKRSGYWRITPGPWQHPQMPSPLAGCQADTKGRVWVSTPTLALVHELAEAGHVGAPEVHEHWTAPGTRKILRPWAEGIRDALAALAPTVHDPDDRAVRDTLKAAYREAIGLFAHAGTSLYRPDWRHAVVAQARVSLWRRLWTNGQADGRWPVSVAVDCVEYASDEADPVAACPSALRLGDGLGAFHVYREPVSA